MIRGIDPVSEPGMVSVSFARAAPTYRGGPS
jgi:hypothetical protein